MSGMNEYLASYFGTNAQAPSEDEIQKQAQAELFLKLAEEEGIDIDQLSDDQVEELYASTFGDEGESVEDDTADQAVAEWYQQKEAADKFAEAEFMGRTMAHAYVDELNKIAGGEEDEREFYEDDEGYVYDSDGDYVDEDGVKLAAGGTVGGPEYKRRGASQYNVQARRAGNAPKLRSGDREWMGSGHRQAFVDGKANPRQGKLKGRKEKSQFGRDKGLDRKTTMGKLRSRGRAVRQSLRRGYLTPGAVGGVSRSDPLAESVGRIVGKGVSGVGSGGRKIKDLAIRGGKATKAFAKTPKGKAALIGGGLAAGAAGAGGIYAATREKKATAALDQYAGELAVEKLAYAGFDPYEAIDLINAVITLDDGEETKVAYADSVDEAVDIRSLELAELAGYPVEWAG